MSGRTRRFWQLAAAAAITVVTAACLVAVWRSRNRADLEGFAGLAISAAGIAAGWIAWVWRHESSRGGEVVSGPELARLADLLAGAAEAEWTRAAGERGLLEPEPIPVRWQRPAAPFAGPVAAAMASTRFAPLPGLAAAVVIVACAAVVLGAVLLGGRDHRSPFVRFMLLVCVLTGRPPGDYLPPGPGER